MIMDRNETIPVYSGRPQKEENEKKRQEDDFNKKASVWGWVATLILAGIPYLLLIVVIEIIKTQFSSISWRSAYGIAGTFIATTIAGIFFATGKKWIMFVSSCSG